jgi:HSP20 family protein
VAAPSFERTLAHQEVFNMFGTIFGSLDAGLFDDLRRLESEMDQLLGRWASPAGIRAVRRGTFPPVNVGSTPDRLDVYVFAAGLDPKTLDISIQQNLLAVSGSRRLETQETADYYRRERFDGDFRRVISLPDDVDPDRVEARYRDGVLQITVQRRESARPRQITVN